MAPTEYVYTKLKDLEVGDRYNVYGIITEILKEKGITKNGRLHSICRIKDESLPSNSTFRIHFFIPSHHSLDGLSVGKIIRLHRVKVEEYQGVIDGRVLSGFDVVIFSNIQKDHTYHTAAKSITLTDFDLNRLEELREMLLVENLFEGDDISSLLVVTDSQRIIFKGSGQQSGSALPKGNERRINSGEEEGGSSDDLDDPNVSRGSSSKEINTESKRRKVVLNPFSNSFKKILSKKKNTPPAKSSKKILSTSGKRLSDNATSSAKECEKSGRLENCSPSSNQVEEQNNMLQKVVANGTNSTCDKGTDVGFEQSSNSCISHNMAEASFNKETIAPNAATGSVPSEEECPGLACAGKNCALEGIVLLKDDDPRIANFDENRLEFEGLGDIPAVDEDGNICKAADVLHFEAGSRAKKTTIGDLLQFSWPKHRSKVKLLKVKPILNSKGPRNLLSGICFKCGRYSLYSRLEWERGSQNKKALCPLCFQDGKMAPVGIEFRIKLTVQDTWGTTLDVYAAKHHASKFLGCSTRQYQQEERCRMRAVRLLSKAMSSKSYFTITLCRKQTIVKPIFYICETDLAQALLEAGVSDI
ncbi:Protection of telomeres protein 1 [Frankliniella fusca]|uniref:Protection of telomeres protein 1 n=1 Tax=Frankliniella fusca TaxID=407009 RepID=A0AAE1LQZ6_9NEOP|nr:Protection of telomeres protein 1 [Frankliniella fusca]